MVKPSLMTTDEWAPVLRITERHAREWLNDPAMRAKLKAVRLGRRWLVPSMVVDAIARGEQPMAAP